MLPKAQIFSIISVIVICTAGRGEARSRCNLLAAGVTAALFILRRTPSDSAERRSQEGCRPLITASVINSFIQDRWGGGVGWGQSFSFPQLKISREKRSKTGRHAAGAPQNCFIFI